MKKFTKAVVLFVALSVVLMVLSERLISTIKERYLQVQEQSLLARMEALSTSAEIWLNQEYREFHLWMNSPVIQNYSENLNENIDPWLNGVVGFLSASEVAISNREGFIISSSNSTTDTFLPKTLITNSSNLLDGQFSLTYLTDNNNVKYIVISIPLFDFEDKLIFIAHFYLGENNNLTSIFDSFNSDERYKVSGLVTEDTEIYPRTELSEDVKSAIFNSILKNRLQYSQGHYFVTTYSEKLKLNFYAAATESNILSTYYIIENLVITSSLIIIAIIGAIIYQAKLSALRMERSNLKYRTSFSDSPDPKILFDKSGNILELNNAAIGLFGKSQSSIKDFEVKEISLAWNKWLSTNRIQQFSMQKGNNHFNCTLKSMENEHDQFLLLVLTETTQMVNISKAIEEKEERLRTTLAATNQGYFDLNFVTQKEYYDPSLLNMLGYKVKHISSRSVLDDLVHEDDYETAIKMNSELFTLQSSKLRTYEMRMKAKSGKWRYILVSTKPISIGPTGPSRIVGVHTDITNRKRSELLLLKEQKNAEKLNIELKNAAKMKDEFLATMSHELRTPLNSVISLSDLMKENKDENLTDDQIKYLSSIESSGRHLLSIINDILDISKIASGKMVMHKEYCLITEIINESITIVSNLAKDKDIKIKTNIDLTTTHVGMDRKRIKQVLINLFSNAIKFTSNGKEIGIDCTQDEEYITMAVWDQGIGIAKSDFGKVFQEFIQIDSKLARQQEGTGLGLSLVKKFIEMHDGSIWVESEVGEGSRFIFTIPIVKSEPISVFT